MLGSQTATLREIRTEDGHVMLHVQAADGRRWTLGLAGPAAMTAADEITRCAEPLMRDAA